MRKNAFEPEYANESYLVLILTPFVGDEQIDRLAHVLKAMIDRCKSKKLQQKNISKDFLFCLPKKVLTPREALFGNTVTVPIDDVCDKICAQVATVCPPGIPVVMPGELITRDVINILKLSGFCSIKTVE